MQMDLDEITSRLTEDKIFHIGRAWFSKELRKEPKPNSQGFVTLRCSEHSDEENPKKGKRASMVFNVKTGMFVCKSCKYKGNLLTVAKRLVGGNSAEAFGLLKSEAGIMEDEKPSTYKPLPKPKQAEPKPIEYAIFDASKAYREVDIDEWFQKIDSLPKQQQYKLVITAIYRESLKADQSPKINYYSGRGIKNNPNLSLIGLIPKDDTKFWKKIEDSVGISRLVEFGFYNPADAKYNPLAFKHNWTGPHCFVPSFDLYSNMLTGAMLRPVIKPKNGAKEFSLSIPNLVSPVPFAITNDSFKNDLPFLITEGSVDGLSFGEVFQSVNIASIPGVNSISEELFGLFRGKKVILALDMDRAGRDAAFGYEDSQKIWHDGLKQKLLKAGATAVKILEWDEKHECKDLNDLLKKGLLNHEHIRQI